MLFDLTKEIILDKKSTKTYQRLRISLYSLAILAALYLSYLVIFPSRLFSLSFDNPKSSKNNIDNLSGDSVAILTNGRLDKEKSFAFYATPTGIYTDTNIQFDLAKSSADPTGSVVEIRKSYRNFFLPEGDPVGFRDGSLIKSSPGYYIVSDGNIRKFSNEKILSDLGFSKDIFVSVSEKELSYNPAGEEVTSTSDYPNGTIFKIEDNFYLLKNDELAKFVSRNAYRSQYDEADAIPKSTDIFQKYPLSKELLGYQDGSLITYADGVFIVSQGQVFPIDTPATFEALGYNWNNLLSASGDEFSLYQKGKIFTSRNAHPEGTVYKIDDGNAWYIIRDNKKHLLPSDAIAHSWSKISPIIIAKKSLVDPAKCTLDLSRGNLTSYSCNATLDDINSLPGKDFEVNFISNTDIKINAIAVDFKKDINYLNFRSSISGLISKIKGNYASTTQAK